MEWNFDGMPDGEWVAVGLERHEPVTAPGLPPGFPEPEKLVTEDCIHPPGGDVCSASALGNKVP